MAKWRLAATLVMTVALWLSVVPAATAGTLVKTGSWTYQNCSFDGRQEYNSTTDWMLGRTTTSDSDCDNVKVAIKFYDGSSQVTYTDYDNDYAQRSTANAVTKTWTRHSGQQTGGPYGPWNYLY